AATKRQAFDIAAVSVAKPGEPICGDAWDVRHHVSGVSAMIADGLGHGVSAHDAASAAVQAFRSRVAQKPADALETIHECLRHTRGAAAAVAELDRTGNLLRYAGVGNIAAVMCDADGARHAVTHTGTLGHQARYFREYAYPWAAGRVLVVHSDGINTQWSFDA